MQPGREVVPNPTPISSWLRSCFVVAPIELFPVTHGLLYENLRLLLTTLRVRTRSLQIMSLTSWPFTPKATKQLLLLQNRSTLCAGHACFFRAELNQLSMSTVCVGIALRHFEARPTTLSVSTANEFTSCIHLFIRNYLS